MKVPGIPGTLGMGQEVDDEVEVCLRSGAIISDRGARTVASWWHSPAPGCRNITRLSHGLEFDADELTFEVIREVSDPGHRKVLLDWARRKASDHEAICLHCERRIIYDVDSEDWVDPEATGDDVMWRETCQDNHEDRIAAHEPPTTDPKES